LTVALVCGITVMVLLDSSTGVRDYSRGAA